MAATPSAALEAEADLGEAFAGLEPGGPDDVGRQVPVAEAEPGLLAVALEHRRRAEGLVADPPALAAVVEAGQRVHDGVVVGADEEAVALEVVGGVDDDGQLVADDRLETGRELRPADATGERDDPHAVRP